MGLKVLHSPAGRVVGCGFTKLPLYRPLCSSWATCPLTSLSGGRQHQETAPLLGLQNGNRKLSARHYTTVDSSQGATRLTNATVYPYNKLPEGPSIRLLTLYPWTHPLSDNGKQVAVSLQTTFLYSEPAEGAENPTYEALSYSWDDPYAPSLLPSDIQTVEDADGKLLCHITVDGKYTVLVTPNLFLALRALQLENKPRSLWIDALCINQSSAEEKSRQIPRMRDIYSKATKVVIWLGEQDWWTRGSVSVINRWAAVYRTSLTRGLYQPEILARLKEWRTFENEEQACFEALVRRAWFTRAWTFQELCLAQDAELRVGDYVFPWEVFRDACAAVIAAGQEQLVFEEHENVRTLYDFYNLCRAMPRPQDRMDDERFQLSRLLQRARPQQSTDPRDKLYSLLAIANPPLRDKNAYRVDYTEPPGDTFRRFVRDMIKDDGDLGILSAVQRARLPVKILEYELRSFLWEEIRRLKGEEKYEEFEMAYAEEALLQVRDEQREDILDGFRRPELEDLESKVSGLSSWVPDLAHQDHVEYVVVDENIKSDLPPSLMRTKFPRPIAQQFHEGWPRYWLNRKFSYRIESGDIVFDTGDPRQLGLWGVRIGKIKRVFSMPFTSDPAVRIPSSYYLSGRATVDPSGSVAQAPPTPYPFNFDFTDRFWPVEDASTVGDEPLLKEDIYRSTGERTAMAVLRTLAADMLPISRRLPDSHKTTFFPFHYDWYFWNRGRNGLPRNFPTSAAVRTQSLGFWGNRIEDSIGSVPKLWELAWLVRQGLRIWHARLTLWLRGGSAKEGWSEFDVGELRNARRIKKLYNGFLLPSEKWDILELAAQAKPNITPSTLKYPALRALALAFPLYFLEHVLNGIFKLLWINGTILQWVPTELMSFGLLLLAWLVLERFVRRIQIFERDVSVPVGWERKAAQLARLRSAARQVGFLASLVSETELTFTKNELESVQGIWAISCEIQNAINRASWNREFFVTENGYIGIGPAGMRPGDEAWSLIGGHVPFILRRSTQDGVKSVYESYQLVGESYVHGVMDGELWSNDRRTWHSLDAMKSLAIKIVLI